MEELEEILSVKWLPYLMRVGGLYKNMTKAWDNYKKINKYANTPWITWKYSKAPLSPGGFLSDHCGVFGKRQSVNNSNFGG